VREFCPRPPGGLGQDDRLDAAVIAHFRRDVLRRASANPIRWPTGWASMCCTGAALQDKIVALEHQRRRLETRPCGNVRNGEHGRLAAEVKEIEAAICRNRRQANPAKKALFACLTALKGVGLVLAVR